MAKRDPKVSIIIPVYNGSNFLANAIDSALAQTYRNIEVVVVNDGSTDNGETERIALSYGKKISYYRKKNGGVASALNFGIKKMTGEYFSWLSHDDIYEKTKIEEEVEYLLAQPNPANTIVASNTFALFENGIKKKEKINQTVFDNHFDIFLGASARVGLNGCSLLIPRDILIKNGGFREGLPVTQDYDLWSRLKDVSKFVLLNKYLVVYRHHDMQDSVKLSRNSLLDSDELRSRILRGVESDSFIEFMNGYRGGEKWLWKNYAVYTARGYMKTPLAILYLLARYYEAYSKSRLSRIERELLAFEGKYYSSVVEQSDNNHFQFTTRILELLDGIAEDNYSFTQIDGSRLRGYIDSMKSDGLLFVARKAVRKLSKTVRGRRQ